LQVKTGHVARHCRAILSHDRGRVGGNPPLELDNEVCQIIIIISLYQ
jgi:hypothetical protein